MAFFLLHYMFASVTAHVTALLPVMLSVGSTVQGLPMQQFALLLLLTLGIMGIITPVRHGTEPVLLRQRVHPVGQVLAARRHLRRDLSSWRFSLIGVPWITMRG